MFLGRHEAVFVHHLDAIVLGNVPDAGMGRHCQIEVTRRLERALFGEAGIARHIERHLHTQHIALAVNAPFDEAGKFRGSGPLPGRAEQVAIGKDEAARHRFQRVNRRVGIFHRLQAMRPVNAGSDASVYRLDGAEEISGMHIFCAEEFAPVDVVVIEIVCEGPVCAVAAQRRLPHVAVGVYHARHQNAAAGVDLYRALWDGELTPDCRDALINDEDITVLDSPQRWVNRQHGGVAEHHWAAGLELMTVRC